MYANLHQWHNMYILLINGQSTLLETLIDRPEVANGFKLVICYIRYVDVILQLIDKAGDFVSDDIWFRVVQYVTNNEDLQVNISTIRPIKTRVSIC